ncbi:MAG: helicase C-terminal domain-containing protein [Eubacteriaceae bacterium]
MYSMSLDNEDKKINRNSSEADHTVPQAGASPAEHSGGNNSQADDAPASVLSDKARSRNDALENRLSEEDTLKDNAAGNDSSGSLVELSVRNLVEFVLKSGSIDKRYSGKNRLLEGAEIHREIQNRDRKIKQDYQSEVYLAGEEYLDDFCFRLNGRADAVYIEEGLTVIEEIKSTGEDLETIEFKEVHKAQLFIYGLLWLRAHPGEQIVLELSYVHLRSRKKRSYRFEEDFKSLSEYMDDLLRHYIQWARLAQEWSVIRNQSSNNLGFVFDHFRRGQREMNLAVWNTLKRRENLLLQAPTGIGKTISALYPSVRMLGNPYERIFYLTARTQTQREAEKAAALMREKGLRLKSVVITAKEKMCPLTPEAEMTCDPEHCPYAGDYFDKINPILYDLLMHETEFSKEKILEIGEKHKLCPFELSLDLSLWADLIICDYNYVFDPSAALIRFEESKDNIYLIDEAHNFPDRSRDMFSAELDDFQFEKVSEACKGIRNSGEIRKSADRIIEQMELLRPKTMKTESVFRVEPAAAFNETLENLIFASDRWYSRKSDLPPTAEEELFMSILSDAVVAVRKYLLISEFYSDSYVTRISRENGTLKIAQLCLDASEMIRSRINGSGSGILFSATFNPFDYYRSVLGLSPDTPALALPSPFPMQNLLVVEDGSVSTRYADRQKSADRIAADIYAFIQGKAGHYMVFFPSFAYLRLVLEPFKNLINESEIKVLEQHPEMSPEERTAFLECLMDSEDDFIPDPGSGQTLAAFCVMGGAFSEGIDLPGDKLIGAVIVSPGIPAVSPERKILQKYYDDKIGRGYEYAYKYPGMNKVLQAAGRVIRTEKDRGAILFIDDRLASWNYRELFPEHLKRRISVKSPAEVERVVKSFWREQNC